LKQVTREPMGTVKLVSCLVAAKIGGRDHCIVVVQGTPVPAGDHRALRVAVSPCAARSTSTAMCSTSCHGLGVCLLGASTSRAC